MANKSDILGDRPCGYQCQFVGAVPEHYYCSKCSLVARELVLTNCCGESFCQACVVADENCPQCGVVKVDTMKPLKYHRKIAELHIYCSHKERGCGWSGLLGELDAHLDPDLDNCQYADVLCPLSCPQAVPKNKMEQHLLGECIKREHTCQHCGFKATYEDVVDTHLPECKYVPIQCPNFCGVTCEREDLEHHMKMCRLQEVSCEFRELGCEETFEREKETSHYDQFVSKHLILVARAERQTAALVLEHEKKIALTQELEEKVEDLQQKNNTLQSALRVQEEKFIDLERKFELQEGLLKAYETKLSTQDEQLQEQKLLLKQVFQEKKAFNTSLISSLKKTGVNISQGFTIESFTQKIEEHRICYSPDMYTHLLGYKFCIAVYAGGVSTSKGKSVSACIHVKNGEYDDNLDWPANAVFSIEVVNQKNGANKKVTTRKLHWNIPSGMQYLEWFTVGSSYSSFDLIQHQHISEYLTIDSFVCKIDVEVS